ncbi:MAG: hypothetical protein ACUVWZ_08930 [Anaerolineae bacterium]
MGCHFDAGRRFMVEWGIAKKGFGEGRAGDGDWMEQALRVRQESDNVFTAVRT